MLLQKTFTIKFAHNLNNTNYYFEYKEGDEFGYFVGMRYGKIQYEIRLDVFDFFMKLEGIQKFNNVIEGLLTT